MSPETLQAIRNAVLIAWGFGSFTWIYGVPAYRWLRAWLYVRFFIRYEMAGCALEAKVREGAK